MKKVEMSPKDFTLEEAQELTLRVIRFIKINKRKLICFDVYNHYIKEESAFEMHFRLRKELYQERGFSGVEAEFLAALAMANKEGFFKSLNKE